MSQWHTASVVAEAVQIASVFIFASKNRKRQKWHHSQRARLGFLVARWRSQAPFRGSSYEVLKHAAACILWRLHRAEGEADGYRGNRQAGRQRTAHLRQQGRCEWSRSPAERRVVYVWGTTSPDNADFNGNTGARATAGRAEISVNVPSRSILRLSTPAFRN